MTQIIQTGGQKQFVQQDIPSEQRLPPKPKKYYCPKCGNEIIKGNNGWIHVEFNGCDFKNLYWDENSNSPPKVQDKYKRETIDMNRDYDWSHPNNDIRNIRIKEKSSVTSIWIYLILLIIILLSYLSITGYEITTGTKYEREFDSYIDFTESTKTKTVIDKTYKIESIFNFGNRQIYEKKTLSTDSSFKEITTKQDYINKMIIIGTSQSDIENVKLALLKTDINILRFIREINIHDTDSVECKNIYRNNMMIATIVGGEITTKEIGNAGCSTNYYPPDEYTSEIDVISSTYYIGSDIEDKNVINEYNSKKEIYESRWGRYREIPYELYNRYQNDYNNYNLAIDNYNKMIENKACSSFEYTLNHEIGHIDGARNNDDSESYADNYANQHTTYKGEC